ncbi:MAG: DNA polymerase III subunit gamma/tau [Patescibacteria group bacterium]
MLYRKYRPQLFNEVVGQQHVVQTLKGALSSGRLSHAYLFSGPRGTGKTTLARILAKALNCKHRAKSGEPDNTCESCLAISEGRSLDLIEIDGASNGRIDEIRNLKDSAAVAAASGGYKVFIIDEAHMVTKEAFNALLKILEEPPAHVVLVLATTDPQKILPTVLSRVQRFDFKKLTSKEIAEKLTMIVKAEKAFVDDTVIASIASSSDGALRDAEVALSKLLSSFGDKEQITIAKATLVLGLIPEHMNPDFLGYLIHNERSLALGFVQQIYHSGHNLEHFTKGFLEYLRKVMIKKISPAVLVSMGEEPSGDSGKRLADLASEIDNQHLLKMLAAFTNVRNDMKISPIPQLPLELAIMELTH